MLLHYARLAFKTIGKHKYYSLINVFGLVCGMLSVLIIGNYIGASLAFDKHHTNRDKIYSVTQRESINGVQQPELPSTYLGVADIIKLFPEVIDVTHYMQHVEALVIAKVENDNIESHVENKIFISDSSFFRIFTFSFIQGDHHTAFLSQNSLVITESTAIKYFPSGDALGKIMSVRTSWGQEISYQVTGVVRDAPPLSRLQFDFLIRASEPNQENMWDVPDYQVFVMLKADARVMELEKKVSAHLAEVAELKKEDKTLTAGLISLAKNPLSPTEHLLLIVGLTIAIICWVNYINQVIAQAFWRVRQVSVLKVLGATKANLAAQFAVEAMAVCSLAALSVFAIYYLFEHRLALLTNGHLVSLSGTGHRINLIILCIFVAGAGLATVAPTLVVLRQRLEHSLRSSFTPGVGGIAIRKLFVVVQFSITTLLVVAIFVMAQQIEFLSTKDKGFDIKNILVVKAPMARDTTWRAKIKTLQLFKQEVAQMPFVQDVSSSTTVPGEEYRQETYLSLNGDDRKVMVHQNGVDENFFKLYKMQFLAGHDFIPDARAKNSESIILNESAMNALGFSNPELAINAKVIDNEDPEVKYDVIGVVKDYHQTSLRYKIRPLAFRYNISRGHCSLKVDQSFLAQSDFEQAKIALQKIWERAYPDAAFDIFFLEERFRQQDQHDEQFGMIFKTFTILSVVLSCLGLFGLSILVSTKRQKEVGVRKTFGATAIDILALFLKGYVPQLFVALIIGSTAAYFIMDNWLTDYANRISISADLILSAVFTLVAIFALTISFHTVKSALTNPVNVLKDS